MKLLRMTLPLALLAAVLSACGTSSSGRRESWPAEPGRETRPLPREPGTGEATPLPPPPGILASIPPNTPRQAEDIAGTAVQALVAQARSAGAVGNHEQAIGALERALRIEPRNPFLWQMLAATHLALGQMDQAETTAQKSNSLARSNPYVEIENWRIIAAVRESQGDANAALQANNRVAELNRLLGGP
jgi:tetratricopeptide (TPR) repeat protein